MTCERLKVKHSHPPPGPHIHFNQTKISIFPTDVLKLFETASEHFFVFLNKWTQFEKSFLVVFILDFGRYELNTTQVCQQRSTA